MPYTREQLQNMTPEQRAAVRAEIMSGKYQEPDQRSMLPQQNPLGGIGRLVAMAGQAYTSGKVPSEAFTENQYDDAMRKLAIQDAWRRANPTTEDQLNQLKLNAVLRKQGQGSQPSVVQPTYDETVDSTGSTVPQSPTVVQNAGPYETTPGEPPMYEMVYQGDDEYGQPIYKNVISEKWKADNAIKQKRGEEQAKADIEAKGKAEQSAPDMETGMGLIRKIIDNPNLRKVSGMGYIRGVVPGTKYYDLQTEIDQVIALVSLLNAGKLKGQGQVSNFERKMVSNAATQLKKGVTYKKAVEELSRIYGVFEKSAQRAKELGVDVNVSEEPLPEPITEEFKATKRGNQYYKG